MKTHGRLFIFDLDDTLVINSKYSNEHYKLPWAPTAKEAMQLLTRYQVNIVIITNQASISKSIFSESEVVRGIEMFMAAAKIERIEIDAVYICPHQDSDFCKCRKPKPAMVEQALVDFMVWPRDVRLFGNSLTDVIAGQSSGVQAFLIKQGELHSHVLREIRILKINEK